MSNRFKRAIHNLVYGDFIVKKEIDRTVAANSDNRQYIRYLHTKDKFETLAFNSKDSGISDCRHLDKEVVISLTTYSKRIHTVFSTIESLFQQTWKANRIILYISDEHFNLENIPETLRVQMKRGLEIRFVKDVRSYTKLVYALQDFPDSYIITVDDDYWYPHDLVERLVKHQQKHVDEICCIECGYLMHSDKEFETINNFKRIFWEKDIIQYDDRFFILEGFAGVLYPPHCLYNDVSRDDLFLSLCPTNDDIWFTVMARLAGTKITAVPAYIDNIEYLTVQNEVQDIGLFLENTNGKFDYQLKRVIAHYDLNNYFFGNTKAQQ